MAANRALAATASYQSFRVVAFPTFRRHFTTGLTLASETSTVPRVASPSFWHSIVPRAFRRPDDLVSVAEREREQREKSSKPKEWNPATFFIAIAVLIGSNAIQSIALRNERLNFTRRTEAKLELLRETIDRVRKGEDVDIEKTLGAGDPARENEWEEVLKEIEHDDALWQAKKRKREQREKKRLIDMNPPPPEVPAHTTSQSQGQDDVSSDTTPRRPGFY